MAVPNKPNIFKSLSNLLSNCIPPSPSIHVKFICSAVIVAYLLSFHNRTIACLAILPGDILPPNFWIWTFFTHNLLEIHWWLALFNLIIMAQYSRLLHPVWGAKEMSIFYIVVNLSVAVLTMLTYFGFYIIMKNPDYIFDIYIHGLAGYIAGFSIALKQIMPEQVMIGSATSYWKCHCRNAPMLFSSIIMFLGLLNCIGHPYMIMFFWGLIASWIYLRFYQRHPNGIRGDNTDNFSFASFFPKHLQPFATICSSITLAVLVMLRICSKQRPSDNDMSTTITVKLCGNEASDNALDMDRRRLPVLRSDARPENFTISDWSASNNRNEMDESCEVDGSNDLDALFVIVDFDLEGDVGSLSKYQKDRN